jgi:uncharacterized protein (DUF2062 family)
MKRYALCIAIVIGFLMAASQSETVVPNVLGIVLMCYSAYRLGILKG